MTTLAFYTKLFVLGLFLIIAGCSSQPELPEQPNVPINPEKELKSTTASEIKSYKEAITYMRNNKLEKAKSLLVDFIDDRPSLAGPWANLGLIYIKQNQLDKAETAINKSLQRNPKQVQALNLLAYLESKKGNFLKSEKLYLNAVKLNSNYALAHYNLALLYDIYLQNIPKAVKHYKYYLKLTGYKDKKTADWLEQLSNSLKKG